MNELQKQTLLKYSKIEPNIFHSNTNSSISLIRYFADQNNITVNKKNRYTYLYSNGDKIGYLKGLRPYTTGSEAFDLCKDKYKLEKFLRKFDVNTLNSELFSANQYEEAYKFIEHNQNTSFVLKPLSLAGGNGIELDVNIENFKEAWLNSMQVQKDNNIDYPSCIIQPFIKGFDVRISIIEGFFVAATLRLPAHIVGDGKHTISELIDIKNISRKKIKYFEKKPIPKDDKLKKKLSLDKLTLTSILNRDQPCILSDISNLTLGGESIDITKIVSPKIIETAINSIAAIPGLYTAGVDIMTDDYLNGDGHIIEINSNANHTMHHLPYKGEIQYPFDYLLKCLLVRYKVRKDIRLNNNELIILKKIFEFSNSKDKNSRKFLN